MARVLVSTELLALTFLGSRATSSTAPQPKPWPAARVILDREFGSLPYRSDHQGEGRTAEDVKGAIRIMAGFDQGAT